MRYVFYGAGAIGGAIGGRLHESGQNVTLIARGEHLREIRDRGLRLAEPGRERTLRMRAVEHPSTIRWNGDEVVVLTMKTQNTLDALVNLAAVAPPTIPVVCAQNGVENERLALRWFSNVYGCVPAVSATHIEPGSVDIFSPRDAGSVDIGRYPFGHDDVAAQISSHLREAAFNSRVEPAIMRWKYGKLLGNLANALDAACGASARGSELDLRARSEAIACYSAAGIEYASEQEYSDRQGDWRHETLPGRAHQGSSSWQSLARSVGSIEADYLNGEIVLLGRSVGISTPVNELLRTVANRLARTRSMPGSVSLSDLMAALDSQAD